MALSKENAIKLKWLWQDGHEAEWIEAFIKITDKEGNIIPFKLTQQQKDFVSNMTNRNCILKARQLGFSVVSLALMLRLAIIKPYTISKIYSFEADSANDNFQKLKTMYDNLPKFLKIKAEANNRDTMKFENGSTITCKTIGKSAKGKGKGSTINGILHLTEFSYYENAHSQLISLTKAVSSSGTIILESTANGVSNYFYKHYLDAKEGINGYKSFFFNWIECRELFEKDYKIAIKKYKAIYNKDLELCDLDDEEKQLIELGAGIDQLTWRRFEIINDGIDKFHQERPATDMEAFIVSGASIFNNQRITTVQTSLSKDNYIPKANITDLPSILQLHYGKSFFMWKLPAQGQRYYIGVDSSEGVGQDYQVVEVFSKDGEQVAEFYNNKIKPYEMSEIIDCIGRYYNKGILNVERASGGHSIIERLRYDYKYMNMVKQKMYDEFNKVRWTIGFDTNSKSKGIIINDMVEMFDKGQIKINSIRVLEEMKTFNISDSGSMGASKGYHDDTVMAVALALFALKDGKYYLW